MRYILKRTSALIFILAASLTVGCDSINQSQKTTTVHGTKLSHVNEKIKQEDTQQNTSDISQSLPVPHINKKNEYDLMGLSIGDSKEKVIELYGEADDYLDREVIGNCLLTDQSLYTYMDYKDKSITIREYFDDSGSYDYQNGIVEMDITGGDYQTKRGIHIGSSLNEVKEKYGIENVFELGQKNNGPHGDIPDIIRIRNDHSSQNIRHFYEYSDFEKIAYVESSKKFKDHCNIPAMIFLFHDNAVSRIIVMNLEQWALI